MIKRIIEKLFKLEPEECKVCDALYHQIEYERQVNKELTETITSLLKPAPIYVAPEGAGTQVPLMPSRIWSRRRAELEKNDLLRAKLANSNLAAKPDDELSASEVKPEIKQQSIEQLEKELGVVDSNHIDENAAVAAGE